MWDEEKAHLAKFNELIPKYKARPSALLPLWNVAGYALGIIETFTKILLDKGMTF
jgi:ubiquinone biosynthesis monooxygenase Coq7